MKDKFQNQIYSRILKINADSKPSAKTVEQMEFENKLKLSVDPLLMFKENILSEVHSQAAKTTIEDIEKL